MRPITLGDLIVLLRHRPQDQQVRFDFGGFIPRAVDSYRGYYKDLALGYDDNWQKPVTVAELLKVLQGVIGQTLTGWKGGEYDMDERTLLWAANRGHSNHTGILGLADCSWPTVLATGWCE